MQNAAPLFPFRTEFGKIYLQIHANLLQYKKIRKGVHYGTEHRS